MDDHTVVSRAVVILDCPDPLHESLMAQLEPRSAIEAS